MGKLNFFLALILLGMILGAFLVILIFRVFQQLFLQHLSNAPYYPYNNPYPHRIIDWKLILGILIIAIMLLFTNFDQLSGIKEWFKQMGQPHPEISKSSLLKPISDYNSVDVSPKYLFSDIPDYKAHAVPKEVYYIQILTTPNLATAKSRQILWEKHYDHPIQIIEIQHKISLFKLLLGPFPTHLDAVSYQKWKNIEGILISDIQSFVHT